MTLWEAIELHARRWKTWKRYDSYQSRRRILLSLLVISGVLLYVGPSFFRWIWKRTPLMAGSNRNAECVEQYLKTTVIEEASFEATITRSYILQESEKRNQFPVYVGNGKFGLAIDKEKFFHIQGKRALDLPLPYYPLIEVESSGAEWESATAVHYVNGVANRITCFSVMSKSATVYETIYAHRLISSLLVQEIKIINPTDVPLVVKLHRKGWQGQKAIKSQPLMVQTQEKTQYFVSQGQVETLEGKESVEFVVAVPEFPETVEVVRQSKKTLVFRTFLNYTKPTPPSELGTKWPQLKSAVRETARRVHELMSSTVQNYHSQVWTNLWKSGFGISYSKAQGAVNGDVINSTIYYILSQKGAFASDVDMFTPSNAEEYRTSYLLSKPDRCYNGHPTLDAPNLWSNLISLDEVNRIVSLWILTLEKQGCHYLVEAGAEGTLQAVILSFAGLQFTKHHLEFDTHPKELHRNYYLRRVRYSNSSFFNITVTVGEDNKASMFVSVDKNVGQKAFYACDGGCLDAPIKLSAAETQFPVKLTQPLTAILYITHDRQHIEELKHAIHVKEVALAPPHEHQVLALHRHGHQLGGLPALFWVSILFLVVVFHLFLAKLIYNEYCGGGTSPPDLSANKDKDKVRYAV